MYILDLINNHEGSRLDCGNKAFSLMRISHELKIPSGFIIMQNMLTDILAYNNFDEQNLDIFIDYDKIRNFIINAELSSEMLDEINMHLDNIPQQYHGSTFAVRSSSINEDSNTHSMAGMFDSFVNISRDEVITSIKHVYASLYSDRIISLCLDGKIKTDELTMSIIVQIYKKGLISGVLFSVDTVEMNKDVYHINFKSGDCVDFIKTMQNQVYILLTKIVMK